MKTFKEFEALHPELRYPDAVHAYNGDYFKENADIGDGATVHLWSDAHAYTIVKRTPSTLTLRRCKCTPTFTPEWEIGGFSAVCLNNDSQTWEYEEDENGEIIIAHWSKKFNRFRYDGMTVTPNRHEFYDYNF